MGKLDSNSGPSSDLWRERQLDLGRIELVGSVDFGELELVSTNSEGDYHEVEEP